MKYNFKAIEKKWQKKWEEGKIFEVKENSKKEKFYMLEMFPYPSGSGLHMGHAWNYSIGDIFARFKIMQGFNVLHPMGYDALGLPAENAAIKVGIHPEEYTKKSTNNFMKQMKLLGLSYDWSRMINTSKPDYYKWDQWIFLKMLEKGLAYRKKASVNWCPSCKTVLANEQVHDGKCWRHEETDVEVKHLKQWFLKITDYADELYEGIDKLTGWPEKTRAMQKHWIGKSYGTEIDFKINDKIWPIFTTRPDTLFGVTFMVVSAQHSKLWDLVTDDQKKEVEKFLKKIKSVSEKDMANLEKEGVFTGSYAINPITKDKVPVYAGNFVVADYGSGMVMAVPAHDQRDFEFAKKYGIEIKRVIQNNLLGAIAGVDKKIEKEFQKNKIEFLVKDNSYFIKSGSSKKEIIFNLIQKDMRLNFYSDIYVNGEIYVITKDKIFNISKGDLNKAQQEVSKLNIPNEFSNLSQIKEDWNSFLYDRTWDMKLKEAYTDSGILINSLNFNGMENEKAKKEITKYLVNQKIGRKVVQFKLKDWGISRQRYWGTPIPVVYCEKCGIVPIPEKDLPVELPKKVKFGKGNPLETAESWIKIKCPKCGGRARRETDTMDTFVNSSWYFLRYCDPKNNKEIFDKKKVDYWCPIDVYIGGAEHACMHLIYCRFYTKFLADLGLLNFREPAKKLFHQGMLYAEGGEKMSKSKGIVVLPETVSNVFGIDTARFFLCGLASPDKNINWSEKGIVGSLRFINKIFDYFKKVNFKDKISKFPDRNCEKIKFGKTFEKVETKLNQTIEKVTKYFGNFEYRKALIEIRELFDLIEKESVSKEVLEKFLKILSPICPHITEELWEKLGNKTFLSLEKWPKFVVKKISRENESSINVVEKLNLNIKNLKKTFGKEKSKVYVYVLPNEFELYKDIKNVQVFAVNDKSKYDPKNKSNKAKPGRPGIYLE